MSSGYMRRVWCLKLKNELTANRLPPRAHNTSNPVWENTACTQWCSDKHVCITCDKGSLQNRTTDSSYKRHYLIIIFRISICDLCVFDIGWNLNVCQFKKLCVNSSYPLNIKGGKTVLHLAFTLQFYFIYTIPSWSLVRQTFFYICVLKRNFRQRKLISHWH